MVVVIRLENQGATQGSSRQVNQKQVLVVGYHKLLVLYYLYLQMLGAVSIFMKRSQHVSTLPPDAHVDAVLCSSALSAFVVYR